MSAGGGVDAGGNTPRQRTEGGGEAGFEPDYSVSLSTTEGGGEGRSRDRHFPRVRVWDFMREIEIVIGN